MAEPQPAEHAPVKPRPHDAALKGLCPCCGTPGLFQSALRFSPQCRGCGLDFGTFNVGDGAAAFLILVIGAIISVLAIWLELRVAPPFWVHLLLWTPLTLALTVATLRYAKGLLLALEYRNAAREGKIVDPE